MLNDAPHESLCSICYEDFADGDPLRLLPCQHYFHVECVHCSPQLCSSPLQMHREPTLLGHALTTFFAMQVHRPLATRRYQGYTSLSVV
jgi:hypothetical protein